MHNDKNVTHTIGHFIGGQHVADNARTQPVYDPATGLSHKSVALASRDTVAQAVASAEAAFPAWRNTPPLKRRICTRRTLRRTQPHPPRYRRTGYASVPS